MATFKRKIKERYGNIYKFAKEKGWSYQRAYYIANRPIDKMNSLTVSAMCSMLQCEIDDL